MTCVSLWRIPNQLIKSKKIQEEGDLRIKINLLKSILILLKYVVPEDAKSRQFGQCFILVPLFGQVFLFLNL